LAERNKKKRLAGKISSRIDFFTKNDRQQFWLEYGSPLKFLVLDQRTQKKNPNWIWSPFPIETENIENGAPYPNWNFLSELKAINTFLDSLSPSVIQRILDVEQLEDLQWD